MYTHLYIRRFVTYLLHTITIGIVSQAVFKYNHDLHCFTFCQITVYLFV